MAGIVRFGQMYRGNGSEKMKRNNGELVVAIRDGLPHLISWSGNTYYVKQIITTWEEKHWWSRVPRRVYFQVVTNRHALEIYRAKDRWYLAGVLNEVVA